MYLATIHAFLLTFLHIRFGNSNDFQIFLCHRKKRKKREREKKQNHENLSKDRNHEHEHVTKPPSNDRRKGSYFSVTPPGIKEETIFLFFLFFSTVSNFPSSKLEQSSHAR